MTTRDLLMSKKSYIIGDVLDLGAGQAKYKKLIQSNARSYTAFDVAEGDNIDVVGDIHELPFADSTFDTIVCTQVFEHISKPWNVVSEIKRILKPGGKIILTAPFMIPYHAHPFDFYRYTTEGMKDLFEEDLTILECERYGLFWTVISELIHFKWMSPYKKHGKFKKIIVTRLINFLKYLDKRSKDQAVYANVYLIAKK